MLTKFREVVQIVSLTLVLALFLKFFVIEAYRIPTGSMENTLLVGDFVLVNKFLYGPKTPRSIPFTAVQLPTLTFPAISRPRRGDVLVFESPGNRDEHAMLSYVKRCVAGPGDTVLVVGDLVRVNGAVPPLPSGAKGEALEPSPGGDSGLLTHSAASSDNQPASIVIPKSGDRISLTPESVDTWRVLMEQEGHTVALRKSDGAILVDGIQTDAYRVEEDYYYMMGDNRGNSLDSRLLGLVSSDRIIGKAVLIYWSWDESTGRSLVDRFTGIRWGRIGGIVR